MNKNKVSKVLMNNGYAMRKRDLWMKTIEGGRIFIRTEDLDSFLGTVGFIISKSGYKYDGKLETKAIFNTFHLNMVIKGLERKSKAKSNEEKNFQTVLIDKYYSLVDSDNNGAEYYKCRDFLEENIKINVKIKKNVIKIEGRIIGLSLNFETLYKGSDFEEFRNVLERFENELKEYIMEDFEGRGEDND